MNELPGRFLAHLIQLGERDRGALAVLRHSLGFTPGSYPPAYPFVERFVPDGPDGDAWRLALYLAAGLFARHPRHQSGVSLARSLGLLMRDRGSPSIEKRFIVLLSTDAEGMPELLRQIVALLAADGRGLDYATLIDDLAKWMRPWASEARDRVRQRWARDFYRTPPESIEQAHVESIHGQESST